MAKIALISQSKDSGEINSLKESLLLQKHEVFCTDALSLLRNFPVFISSGFDVCHFIFQDNPKKLSLLDLTALTLLAPFTRITKVASFYISPRQVSPWIGGLICSQAQAVSWASRDHYLYAKRKWKILNHNYTAIIPPLAHFKATSREIIEGEKLKQSLQPFIIIPTDPSLFLNRYRNKEELGLQNYNLLFYGERNNYVQLKGVVIAKENENLLRELVPACSATLTAFSDLSIIELRKLQDWSLQAKSPMIVSVHQAEMVPGIVVNDKTGWILDQGVISLRSLLSKNPQLKISKPEFEHHNFQLTDSIVNEINRLYNQSSGFIQQFR